MSKRIETKDEDRPHMVWLRISSYRGISFNAVHYYGKLMDDTGLFANAVALQRTLTALEAEKLNIQHQTEESHFAYKAGSEVPNFDREGDVITQAIRVWRKHFPGKTILVLGDPLYSEHEELLVQVK